MLNKIIVCLSTTVLFLHSVGLVLTLEINFRGHVCRHEVPDVNQVVYNVNLEPFRIVRKRSVDQALRIHLVYDTSLADLSNEQRHLVKNNLLPAAVDFWQHTLQVRSTNKPITLLRQCTSDKQRYRDGDRQPYCVNGCANITMCGESVVPEDHLQACLQAPINGDFESIGTAGPGVSNADFVLYVSTKSLDRCKIGTTVAYTAYCQLESALDRPIAGYVNLCPESISTKLHEIHQMQSTIKHEILHALGFSVGLFAFYRDDAGDPLTPRFKSTGRPAYNRTTKLHQWSDRIVRPVTRPSWQVRSGVIEKTVHMVVTPSVVREVRQHFNCSTLEGAELEDQGVTGTFLTHWEKRVFENEMMTGTYTQNPMISRMTLALMQDTGWYHVNYKMADAYQLGRNLGCEFVTQSCREWITEREQRGEHVYPYCKRAKKGGLLTQCTDDRDAIALCNLVEYDTEIPLQYQYFDNLSGVSSDDVTKYGGSVVLADYCPYLQEFTWKKDDKVIRGSHCGIPHNNPDPSINYSLEKYGTSSRCFDHGSKWSVRHCNNVYSVEHWGSGCYEYDCSESTGLTIVVNGVRFPCPLSGNHSVRVAIATDEWLHEGSITCPLCVEVCPSDMCPERLSTWSTQSLDYNVTAPCTASALFRLGAVVNTGLTQLAVFLTLYMSDLL